MSHPTIDAAKRRLRALIRPGVPDAPARPASEFEPLPSMYAPILSEADGMAQDGAPIGDVLTVLRRLPLDDFGQLMFQMPDETYPGLSRLLPRMAPEAVQRKWTGDHGAQLLRQSTVFVRSLRQFGMALTGKPLDGGRIMDFGCGYGRMLRLMLHVTDPERLCGVDAWEESLQHCRDAGLPNSLGLSDALPTALPFSERPFDLIFAFSVFTHLSPKAASACLRAMRRAVAPDGLVAITFRPVEYWSSRQRHLKPPLPDARLRELQRRHARKGIAYLPRQRGAGADGEGHYGHTSMSFQHLQSLPGWELAAIDRHIHDPYQPIAYLRPIRRGAGAVRSTAASPAVRA